jgi:excisionase family DNA binding protein
MSFEFDEFDSKVADIILRIRVPNGFVQYKLAEVLDENPSTISSWKTGDWLPKRHNWAQFKKLFPWYEGEGGENREQFDQDTMVDARRGGGPSIDREAKSEELKEEKLLNIHEMAAVLQVPRSWIYDKTRQKGENPIPVLRVGKYLRFKPEAVIEWLKNKQEK